MKLSHKITALTSTILLSVAIVSPASAAETQPLRKSNSAPLTVAAAPVTVPASAPFSLDLEAVTSLPAKEPAVVEVMVAQTPQTSAPAVTTPTPTPAVPAAPVTTPAPVALPTAPVPVAAPAVPVPVQAVPTGSGHGGLAAAARAQLGVQQDCTRMVENALAAIGKPVGDLGPAQFLSVGTIVAGPPQAGDILVYGNSHVAISIGGGQAIHGGFNGGTTGVGPVDVGQGAPTVVRV